jgi:hypothetical protein
MKSKWKVSSQSFDGVKHYQVYRRIDMDEVDHSGNREYEGHVFLNQEEAQKVANELNGEGKC